MTNEVATVAQPITPMQMLGMAIEKGADIGALKGLMDLNERWQATEARKGFVSALNAFKANPPILVRDKHVKFQTSKGTTEYEHASLDQVSAELGKALALHGISHRWTMDQSGARIKVTCILTHVLGHSESVSLESPPDESGGKNSIQAISSAVTYLQRYTLLAATGMAVQGQDDDGAGAGAVGAIAEILEAPDMDTLKTIFEGHYKKARDERNQQLTKSLISAKEQRKTQLAKVTA